MASHHEDASVERHTRDRRGPHHDVTTGAVVPAGGESGEVMVDTGGATAAHEAQPVVNEPEMVQHWHCEVREGVRKCEADASFGSFVVTVCPVFPLVYMDPDPEFNAIHQYRANLKRVIQFVHFLQQVLGERKMAMMNNDSELKDDSDDSDDALCLLWADQQWTWLDEVSGNELQLLTSAETELMSDKFHVVLVGELVPFLGDTRLRPHRNQGFEGLVRVLEELSTGGYFIRLHEMQPRTQENTSSLPAKHVQIFR